MEVKCLSVNRVQTLRIASRSKRETQLSLTARSILCVADLPPPLKTRPSSYVLPHIIYSDIVDTLLGRGLVIASSAISVEVFDQFFAEKVAKGRESTRDAAPATFSRA